MTNISKGQFFQAVADIVESLEKSRGRDDGCLEGSYLIRDYPQVKTTVMMVYADLLERRSLRAVAHLEIGWEHFQALRVGKAA